MVSTSPSLRRVLGGDWLRSVLVLIGAVTVVSGLGQMLLPGVVLTVLGGESTPTTRHFFAIVGMFMLVVGGLLVHALLRPPTPAYVLLWTGLQKFGAFVMVSLAVGGGLFSGLALPVALFDLATAVLCAVMWWRLR